MIVVPTFSERDEREPSVVAAAVSRFVTARAPDVRERVDGEGAMPENRRAEKKSPREPGPSPDRENRARVRDSRHEMPAIEPPELGILREIRKLFPASLVVFRADD